MDVTLESVFSDPMAFRYSSADRRFNTRRARRSVITNFPDASTLKSVQRPTMTAALPSPKWPRSTRPAAASQSGTESARRMERSPEQSKAAPRHSSAAIASLLFAQNDDFLIIFGNLIEEFLGIQIVDIGGQQNFFQIESARAGHHRGTLGAGSRESSEIVVDLDFLGQLLHLDFRRQLPGAGAVP